MKNITQLVFHAKKSAVAKGVARAGTIWFDSDDRDEIDALSTLAMKEAGFRRSDFFKPVRVDHLVVDDMPAEGVFDTAFCERYKLAEDGKSWQLSASPEPTDPGDTASAAGTSTGVVTDTVTADSAENLPAYACNANDEPMEEATKEAEVSIATLSLVQRFLHLFFFGEEENGKYRHHATPAQRKDIIRTEMDMDNRYVQNMLTGVRAHPELDKLDNHRLFELTDAIGEIFHYPADGEFSPAFADNFISAWLNTEHIDHGLLVKEWQKGNRVSRIEKPTATSASEVPATQKKPVAKAVEVEYPRRSEKATHRTINIEIASALIPEADPCNLRPVLNQAKDIIHSDREGWKRWSATLSIIPEIKTYSRQTIFDVIRKAPKAVHTGNPDLRRTWCESFLAVHGIRDPDWYEHEPDNVPTTHEENTARVRKAAKCLRDIEAGRFLCDEEEPQSAGALADEPAVPETVEPDATEHNQDAQPLDAQSQVDPVEVAYQKKRAELEEARKNIPPKNPVDFGKQLAAARGEYVEGISDPNDPKWVRDDYSASNKGEKTENEDADDVNQNDDTAIQNTDSVNHSEPFADQIEPEVLETEPKSLQPEPVTKVADGVFDASAFFADTSNQGEKTENPPSINDDRSIEIKEEKNTAAFDQNGPVLEKIARLLEVNNQLLETSISHQFAAFRRREKFLKSLVLALTTCCENHNTEDETDEQ
ncbi:hypothetical protein NRW17_000241 [Salmonella enterica]|nr:hypothetical protein [Salmonella enterica]EHK0209856.1 hypothetical protein [Salmonella enterica]EJM7076395.1 hypothetical protein [Salmonella enterica]EJN7333307.1 hypothetical protein [Salmonella enterica]EJO7599403.1 hypothetical protein [Salmonella enterica]